MNRYIRLLTSLGLLAVGLVVHQDPGKGWEVFGGLMFLTGLISTITTLYLDG